MVAFTTPVLTVFYQGQVASGAKVYVYQTGTTTPVITYSDAALTTPNTSPITADANGQVVFSIGATIAIRVDTYTSDGAFIRTIDPIYPAANYTSGGSAGEASIVAASTTNLGATGSNIVAISGNTTILSLGASASVATPLYTCRLTGAPLLTHNGTSLILPGGANIQGAAGDAFIAEYAGAGNWRVMFYQKASGASVVQPSIVQSSIAGLLPTSVTGTNTTAAVTISAGQASDSTNTAYLNLSGSSSWAVSNGNAINGYQGGTTLPNTSDIHFFICSGTSGTGTFASTSLTPTLPTGYTTAFRRIFSLTTTGAGALADGAPTEAEGGSLIYELKTQNLDVNGASIGTSRSLVTLPVPKGIKVEPMFRAVGDGSNKCLIITSGDGPDVVPPAYAAGWTTAAGWDLNATFGNAVVSTGPWITNTSGQIGMRANAAGMLVYVVVRGWKDFRRS